MEPRERMLLEVVAGAVLIIFLVLASVMVVSAYKNPETTITNSYNTYNTYPTRTELVYSKPYFVDRRDYRDYSRDNDVRYTKSDDRYLIYDDFGNFRKYKGVVGNRVNSYEVYVTNRDYVGGYFKTVFYFEDYYGNVDSESMTNYIPAREEKRFVLKDVSPSRYDYRRWWYRVTPMTKAPTTSDSQQRNYFYMN